MHLKKFSTPKALVKRDGQLKEIPSEEVVVGDIIIIDAGRYIPADLRILESANLKIEESAFTGESVPADKNSETIVSEVKMFLLEISIICYLCLLLLLMVEELV